MNNFNNKKNPCKILLVPDILSCLLDFYFQINICLLEECIHSTVLQCNAMIWTWIMECKEITGMSFHKEVTSHVDCMLHSCSYHKRREEGSKTKAHSSWAAHRFLQSVCRGFLCGCAIATELQIHVANYWLKLNSHHAGDWVKGGRQPETEGILLLGSWPLRDAWLRGAWAHVNRCSINPLGWRRLTNGRTERLHVGDTMSLILLCLFAMHGRRWINEGEDEKNPFIYLLACLKIPLILHSVHFPSPFSFSLSLSHSLPQFLSSLHSSKPVA